MEVKPPSASAAKLALYIHSVTIYELPVFADSVEAAAIENRIALDFERATKTASLQDVTTDISSALDGSALVLAMVYAYAHSTTAMACVRHPNTDRMLRIA